MKKTITAITRIISDAFSYYENLEYISIPDSINYINDLAFEDTLWYNNRSDDVLYNSIIDIADLAILRQYICKDSIKLSPEK